MPRKFVLVLTSGFLLLVSAGTLSSQFRTRVDLVVVPVSVRDNNGFLLTSLEREDFTVLEDGRPQEITTFSIDAQPLSVAIVVDDGISSAALKRVAPLLPSTVTSFTADDEMTSFRYDHFVWRLSDFTSDRDQFAKSFLELKRIADARPDDPPEPPALYQKIEKKTPAWVKAIAGIFSLGSNGAPSPIPTAPAPKPAAASRTMHSAVYEAALALQNRAEDHRKIILLVSDGEVREPQISIVPGRALHSFDKNVELLIKGEIEVYSVNTVGTLLEKPSGMLDSYARATGGDVYGGITASDMEFAVRRIVQQARTQYVLGYVSTNTAPRLGIYRKIEVRSGDPDQKRKVTHRSGYYQFPIPK